MNFGNSRLADLLPFRKYPDGECGRLSSWNDTRLPLPSLSVTSFPPEAMFPPLSPAVAPLYSISVGSGATVVSPNEPK